MRAHLQFDWTSYLVGFTFQWSKAVRVLFVQIHFLSLSLELELG